MSEYEMIFKKSKKRIQQYCEELSAKTLFILRNSRKKEMARHKTGDCYPDCQICYYCGISAL